MSDVPRLADAVKLDADDDLIDPEEDDDCLCDFSATCDGFGMLICEDCGCDLCVCTCGVEVECPGCEDCKDLDEDF